MGEILENHENYVLVCVHPSRNVTKEDGCAKIQFFGKNHHIRATQTAKAFEWKIHTEGDETER